MTHKFSEFNNGLFVRGRVNDSSLMVLLRIEISLNPRGQTRRKHIIFLS